jgi:ABC-2 type transport system permease protein
MPVFVMAMVGLAMSGYSTPSLWVGVLGAQTPAARALVEALEADGHLRVRAYDDRERLRIAVYRGRLHGGLIFPPTWDGEEDLEVYASKAGAGTPVLRTMLDRALARQRVPAAPGATTEVLDGETLGNPPTGYQYTAPSNLVLFVMMNAIIGSVGIVAQRRTGLGWRLLAAPLGRAKLTLGLAVSPLQLMGTQAVFLLAVGALVFYVSWGDPLGVALITVSLVAVGTALCIFLGTVFRTESQPGNLGPFLAILLGMLGGCMWPLEIVPDWVVGLGHLFPTAWAMDGYLALVFGRAPWTAVLPEAAVLLGMATLFGTAGVMRLQRQLSGR